MYILQTSVACSVQAHSTLFFGDDVIAFVASGSSSSISESSISHKLGDISLGDTLSRMPLHKSEPASSTKQ